jgi:uncharacterized RDD family membrane protein YckC
MSTMPPPPPPPSNISSYPTDAYMGAGEYAGFGIRLGGRLLDGILYGLLGAVFYIPAFIMGAAAVKDCTRTTSGDTTSIDCTGDQLKGGLLAGAIALGAIGLIVVVLLYVKHLGSTGQTWGRRIVGVKVVDKVTKQPIGFGRAFGRSIIENTISGWLCWLGFLWMLWDADKQTWHDKIVNSVVVRTN